MFESRCLTSGVYRRDGRLCRSGRVVFAGCVCILESKCEVGQCGYKSVQQAVVKGGRSSVDCAGRGEHGKRIWA